MSYFTFDLPSDVWESKLEKNFYDPLNEKLLDAYVPTGGFGRTLTVDPIQSAVESAAHELMLALYEEFPQHFPENSNVKSVVGLPIFSFEWMRCDYNGVCKHMRSSVTFERPSVCGTFFCMWEPAIKDTCIGTYAISNGDAGLMKRLYAPRLDVDRLNVMVQKLIDVHPLRVAALAKHGIEAGPVPMLLTSLPF